MNTLIQVITEGSVLVFSEHIKRGVRKNEIVVVENGKSYLWEDSGRLEFLGTLSGTYLTFVNGGGSIIGYVSTDRLMVNITVEELGETSWLRRDEYALDLKVSDLDGYGTIRQFGKDTTKRLGEGLIYRLHVCNFWWFHNAERNPFLYFRDGKELTRLFNPPESFWCRGK